MPLWHKEQNGNLVMYLYDRAQNHGNHNLSHFHITYKNKDVIFDIKGNKLEGNCDNEKEIGEYIKKHRNYIHKCLNKITHGKEFKPIEENIF